MKYRHAYHAGNFADVHKHITLLALLAALKRKKLVLYCRKEQRTRAALRVTVEEDAGPAPGEVHPTDLCPEVRRRVPARVLFESYFDDGDSVYDRVA